MSAVVWKYPLPVGVAVSIDMPEGAEILHVADQHDTPHLWAVVDPDRPLVTRRFEIAGTGHPIKATERRHVGTFLMRGGDLVFHLFETGSAACPGDYEARRPVSEVRA